MKKDPKIFVVHIVESIDIVKKYVAGKKKTDFMKSEELQDALVRRLEIIGEASKNIPLSFQRENSNIPWRDMAGLRNKLIHEYFIVDMEIVWQVIKDDLPKLEIKLKKLLQ